MIVHISMAKYKDSAEGRSKAENIAIGKQMTEGLLEKVPSLKSIRVGVNMLDGPTDYDVVSTSEYDNMDAVMVTVRHPAHDDLIAFLKTATEASHAVTYEVAGR
jgi:hypothetical protein